MTIETLAAIVVSGLVAGSLYALMASGLSLVWGTLRMFNFAHGTLLMLGAYAAWYVSDARGLDLGLRLGIPVALVSLRLLGIVLYWLLVRPFIARPGADLVVIITTLAGAAFLQNGGAGGLRPPLQAAGPGGARGRSSSSIRRSACRRC